MRGMTQMHRSRAAKIAGSVALGLGLLTLGTLALMTLGLALPATSALADRHDRDRDDSDQGRTEGAAFHWSGRIASGKTLEIRGISGSIDAELAEGREARVDARKSGRKSDPDEVKIEVSEEGDRVLVCARYPRPDGRLNDCDDHEGQHVEDNDVQVRFQVKVPAGVRLVARNVNGAIGIAGLQSDVEASTVNGAVRVGTSGTASATTVNGSVTARIGTDLDDDLEFTTVNGRVLVEMPRGVNADVRGSTVHGSIYTDFPLSVRGRAWGNRRLAGTIGRGGHELRLATVNGSIELRSLDRSGKRRPVESEDEDDGGDDGDPGDTR